MERRWPGSVGPRPDDPPAAEHFQPQASGRLSVIQLWSNVSIQPAIFDQPRAWIAQWVGHGEMSRSTRGLAERQVGD
jgi:hypothetical protein